jgi:hypothetical protein
MYFYPRSKIGRVSFWLAVVSLALMYVQYWFAMIFETSVRFPGLLVVLGICAGGVSAVVALTKYKDQAVLLIIAAIIGLLGFAMVIGELLLPH